MRKSLWITPSLLLFVAISAPNAQADSFTYTYTEPFFGISWTTAAISGISAATTQITVPAADLTASSNTGRSAGCVTKSVTLDSLGNALTIFTTGAPCGSVSSGDGFALSDYSTPGTYPGAISGDSLVVTRAVAPVPEPSSAVLTLLGLALVLLLRKRNSRGHQLAT